jgi:ABC-type transport system involved in cytochrome c biogenesis permease component
MSFASIASIHDPVLGAMDRLIFVAVAALVFGMSVGGDAEAFFARPAAGLSLIVALLLAGSIVRFERRQ